MPTDDQQQMDPQDDQRDATLTDQTDDAADLGDKGKEALRREREARRTAEKAAKDAQDRAAALEAEARKRADAEAAEQGKWQELAEQREAELSTIATERDTLKAEHDALQAYFADQYAAAVKELPDVIREFAPDADASFAAKAAWLSKAQAQAKKLDTATPRGNAGNPKPSAGGFDQDAEVQRARARGAYRL